MFPATVKIRKRPQKYFPFSRNDGHYMTSFILTWSYNNSKRTKQFFKKSYPFLLRPYSNQTILSNSYSKQWYKTSFSKEKVWMCSYICRNNITTQLRTAHRLWAMHARGSGEAARRAKRGRQPLVTRVAICVSRVLLDGLQKKERLLVV